ncbi:MAG: hypothetical protein AB1796_10525 [Bacillota bacterium]
MNSSLKNYLLIAVVVLLLFNVFNNYILARPVNGNSNSFFSGGSCCRVGGSPGATSEQLQQQGLAYYASSTGETAEDAVVKNFGCHQEIFIYKDGELVMRLAYANGRLFEI